MISRNKYVAVCILPTWLADCNNKLMLKYCKSFRQLLQVFGAFILLILLHVQEALATLHQAVILI